MTMDAASYQLFGQLIALSARTLLQYVSDSSVWTQNREDAAYTQIVTLAREERDATAGFLRHLQKQHLRSPGLGAYPSHFTSTNFVAVSYLVPKLIAENVKEIDATKRLLAGMKDETIRVQTERYLAMKERHLAMLRELATQTVPSTK